MICTYGRCSNEVSKRGLCRTHYNKRPREGVKVTIPTLPWLTIVGVGHDFTGRFRHAQSWWTLDNGETRFIPMCTTWHRLDPMGTKGVEDCPHCLRILRCHGLIS